MDFLKKNTIISLHWHEIHSFPELTVQLTAFMHVSVYKQILMSRNYMFILKA